MKLVRDKIPEIIKSGGRNPIYKKMDGIEFKKYLDEKLIEEVNEYLENNSLEELCDVAEVIYALLDEIKITKEEFEAQRLKKVSTNGAFKDKVLLIEIK